MIYILNWICDEVPLSYPIAEDFVDVTEWEPELADTLLRDLKRQFQDGTWKLAD